VVSVTFPNYCKSELDRILISDYIRVLQGLLQLARQQGLLIQACALRHLLFLCAVLSNCLMVKIPLIGVEELAGTA